MVRHNWGSAVGAKEFDRYAAVCVCGGGRVANHKLRTANAALACGYNLSRLRRTPRDYVAFAFLARLHVATNFRGYAAPRATTSRLPFLVPC